METVSFAAIKKYVRDVTEPNFKFLFAGKYGGGE
jgi:hypothetical protein